jgi:hypothetical protein
MYWLAGVTLVATLVVVTLTLGDFLALHDIRNEYVSADILKSLGVNLSGDLPDWTATAGEWRLVQVSYLARAAFLILNAITLSLFVLMLRRQVRDNSAAL